MIHCVCNVGVNSPWMTFLMPRSNPGSQILEVTSSVHMRISILFQKKSKILEQCSILLLDRKTKFVLQLFQQWIRSPSGHLLSCCHHTAQHSIQMSTRQASNSSRPDYIIDVQKLLSQSTEALPLNALPLNASPLLSFRTISSKLSMIDMSLITWVTQPRETQTAEVLPVTSALDGM